MTEKVRGTTFLKHLCLPACTITARQEGTRVKTRLQHFCLSLVSMWSHCDVGVYVENCPMLLGNEWDTHGLIFHGERQA